MRFGTTDSSTTIIAIINVGTPFKVPDSVVPPTFIDMVYLW